MAIGLLKIGRRKVGQTLLNEVMVDLHVFSETINTDEYTDITSNENWMTIGLWHYDFMFCRNQVITSTYVQTTVMGNPFSALTQSDQEWAARVYAVGKTERESVYSQVELQDFWNHFISEASVSRRKRWTAAKNYISFNLSVADSIDIAKTTNILSNEYIIYGIEEYSADGVDGLFDWVESSSGFSGGTGFDAKSYYTTELKENMMTILRDGIY